MTNPLIDSKDKSQAFQGEGRYLVIWAEKGIFDYRDDLPYTSLAEMKWDDEMGLVELSPSVKQTPICFIVDFHTGLHARVIAHGWKRSYVLWYRAKHDEKGNPHYHQIMWVAAGLPKRVQP